ncbi:MAG: choice-of-anchor Q domain-containing protein [Candidatus Acidiferrum sp.]
MKNLLASSVSLAEVVISMLMIIGCGASTTRTPTPVSVTISPTLATVATGATQQFTATVQNTSNTAVTWQVNGVAGGNATVGAISTSGLYTAPAVVPSPATVTVTAVSQADPTKSASAQVTITPTAAVSVTISPTLATVVAGGTQQFTATVQNTSNTAVAWQVNGVAGGNTTIGTISSSGLYTAPAVVPSPATVTVTAVSQADPTKSASAQVTITALIGKAFYVSTTGSDSNPGTITSPWRTVQHAANSVQAGDTVFVRGGVYNESVNISASGSAIAGPITFQSYPGENAIVDGTGLVPSTSGTQGLFNMANQSYISIQGFEIRNYQTSSASATPAGIWVSGAGSNIQILNNLIHNIVTTSETAGSAFGIAVYGTAAPASLDSVTISGNQVYALKTGNSESVNVDGNVTNFTITNNVIHDNDNIGIDVIGFEGVSPDPAYDYARNGTVAGNIIYNISAINNPGESNQYDANGIYVDGGSQVVIERNLIHNVDIGIEMASEHQGHVTSFVTARNNLVCASNSVGITIGGYAANVGGTDHSTIVNNTLFQNDSKNTGSGEFQIQYYATNNVFKNNIVYAWSQGLFINNYTNSEPDPADVDYNLYYSSLNSSMANFVWNGVNQTGFSSYQSATGKDGRSQYADPKFLSLTTPDLQIQPTSPAVNAGRNLGPMVVGALDFAGNPRVLGSGIDIGAYEQ